MKKCNKIHTNNSSLNCTHNIIKNKKETTNYCPQMELAMKS